MNKIHGQVKVVLAGIVLFAVLPAVYGRSPTSSAPPSQSSLPSTGSTTRVDAGSITPSEVVAGTRSPDWKACAEKLGPQGGISTTSLERMFERPQSVAQLLQNLKLAWENDWLLRTDFYDEETLLKFFSGTTITWKSKIDPLGSEVIELDTGSGVFPKMSVTVQASCSQAHKLLDIGGSIRIYGSPIPELTLGYVRQLLGPETENTLDIGYSSGGSEYTPHIKGSVTYTNRAKERFEGRMGLIFYFTIPTAVPGGMSPIPARPPQKEIEAEDVVRAIVLTARRHLKMGN